jgi:IclR family KDG regulon transcriptional repressor
MASSRGFRHDEGDGVMTMSDDADKDPPNASGSIIQSVVVAASVLEALAAAGKPTRLTELAEQLGEAKARIHRHLTTLRSVGLVDQDQSSERYRLGWKLVNLGQAAADQFEIRAIAEPFMLRLRDLAHQTCVLSVPVNGEAMVTTVMESANLVTISVRRGARLPAHASAQGRIALAFAAPEVQKRILARKLPMLTPHSITDPGLIRERIAAIRERLHEHAPGETLLGISTLAAPILDHEDRLVGIIALLGSEQDIPVPLRQEQVHLVQSCAAAISSKLHAQAYRRFGLDWERHFNLD